MNNNKFLVLYESRYGSTKKYAEFISTELNADLKQIKDINNLDFDLYQTIIIGGWLHACYIKGLNKLKKYLYKLDDKNLIIFTVGLASGTENDLAKVKKLNLNAFPKDKINFFYFRGAFNYKHLKPIDKILMSLLKKKVLSTAKKRELSEDEKCLLECYDKPISFINKNSINKLINYANSL